jgi:hypothetical protein
MDLFRRRADNPGPMRAFALSCLVPCLLVAVACDDKAPKKTVAAAAPSAVETQAVTAPPPTRVAPADVQLESYLNDLKCGKKASTDSCRILMDFSTGTRATFNMPSGKGRWVGNAFIRDKGVEKKQITMFWAKRVPTGQVGPGDLPLRMGSGELGGDLLEHGMKMVRALSQGDSASKRNQARPVVEAFVPTTQRGAVNTQGASVRLISEETVYLRQSGRKLLMFAPNLSQSATAGDGTYAEFWVSTW